MAHFPTVMRRIDPATLPGMAAAAAMAALRASNDCMTRRRGPQAGARARALAAYLQHVALGDSLSACSRLYARDRNTLRKACGRIEDARDDGDFDAAVTALEAALRRFAAQTLDVQHSRWR